MPGERFERESLAAWLARLAWLVSGRYDDDRARAAAAALVDAEEQLLARGQLAIGDARVAAVRRDGDWRPPLLELRRELGSRADGIFRHEWWGNERTMSLTLGAVLATAAAIGDRFF